jgi:transcriptional regulator with XRE-family HTH domain
MNRNLLGKNLRVFRKRLNLNQVEFAKPLGIKGSYISAIERGKSVPSESVLLHLEEKYRLNRKWLLTGEGEPYIKDKEKPGGEGGEAGPPAKEGTTYKDRSEEAEDGFKVSDALTMTAQVLESGTSYATALYMNIQHFNRAIQAEARITELEKKDQAQTDRINHLEGECETLRKRLEALEARIASQEKEKEDALPEAAENK